MYKTVCLHGIAFLISLGLGIFLISSLSFSEPSISAARIDEYLRGKHSPLAEHGSIFIDNGIEFDVGFPIASA